MKKLLALVLATMLLASQAGVTIASMTCVRTGKSVPMCHYCHEVQRGASISAKSCCVFSAKRLALKDNFARPASPTTRIQLVGTVKPPTAAVLVSRRSASTLASSHAPPSAREYCALVSNFRI